MKAQANVVLPRWGGIRGHLVLLIALSGCFRDPDTTKLVCQTDEECPTGHWCRTADHSCQTGAGPGDANASSTGGDSAASEVAIGDEGSPMAIDTSTTRNDTPISLASMDGASNVEAGLSIETNLGTGGVLGNPDGALHDAEGSSADGTPDLPLPGTGGAAGGVGTGGETGAGGVAGTSGAGSGGVATGGVVSVGGIVGAGGAANTGGIAGTGGVVGTGGIAGTGGVPGTGGTTAASPVINSFTATPTTITSGKGTTLTWSATGATQLSIAGVGTVSGTQWTVSPTQNTTYVLTAKDAAGNSVSAQVVVTVVAAPSIASFTANSTAIAPGSSTKLNPVFSGGTGRIDQSIGMTVTSGGSYDTGALSAKTTFTLTVTNAASDAVTANVTVAVVGFVPAGSMLAARSQHTATMLANGKVLLAGGSSQPDAELYDESTGTFVAVSSTMSSLRSEHTATRLKNGKVLIAGGYSGGNGGAVSSADLYDPSTGTTGSFNAVLVPMTTTRSTFTATLLPNGQVLLAGGISTSGSSISAEIFDPASGGNGTFTATSNMLVARDSHTAVALPSGQVLIAGGENGVTNTALSEAELFFNGTFTATGFMKSARAAHSSVLLADGRVLLAGGYNGSTFVASAEVYDPQTGTFTLLDTTMSTPRITMAAARLTDNTVLITGGQNNPFATPLAVDLYDPSSGINGALRATASMLTPRMNHTATLLDSGKVLVAGGDSLGTAELYIH